MNETMQMAYGVLFPVVLDLKIGDPIARFLDQGGKSLLFGETADEYRSGKLSEQRIQLERLEAWQRMADEVKARAGSAILAADADIAAVNRLEAVTTRLPDRGAAQRLSGTVLEEVCFQLGLEIKKTGINLALSPTADVVTGSNAWLEGRTLSEDPVKSAEMVRAYVRGTNRARLKSSLKHFPGNPICLGSPASDLATVPVSLAELKALWQPFQAGIEEGVSAVMMSPARYDALRHSTPGSLSAEFIGMLKDELRFSGLVMTCDLDHRATLGDSTLEQVVVTALGSGADMLLLSPNAVPSIDTLARSITDAVENGTLAESRLREAYRKIAGFAADN